MSMKKKTKYQLRREINKIKEAFTLAIHLKCYDCQGLGADGVKCNLTGCPLYPYRLKSGNLKSKNLRKLLERLRDVSRKDKAPKPSYWREVYRKILS